MTEGTCEAVAAGKRKAKSGRTRKPEPSRAKPMGLGRAAASAVRTSFGRFCWYDLATTDVPGSLRFYGELLGWTIRSTDMGPMGAYHVVSVDGAEFAGVMPLASRETPPCWLGHVGVPDIGAACTAATNAKGSIHRPPTSVPGAGGFAVVGDPTGGVVAPIQLGGPPPRDLAAATVPGLPAWNELVTADPALAGAFYARVFGWTIHPIDLTGSPYWIFRHKGDDVAGMIEAPASPVPEPASWMVYFHVADADAVAAKVAGIGGAVLIPPFDVATVGRCALIADPAGVTFRIVRPEPEEE
ncbi:MAG: VOC family protein [Deltaproteobacteria bacterium]|nr:VOC family protein [Deltaproteobacteria bacterium]